MTAATPSANLWNSMPGWGVVANLLPPEITAARRARVLRKLMTAVLATVLVLCAAGYGWAYWQTHQASSALAAEQSTTTGLQSQQHQYSDVVQIKGTVAAVKSRLAALLADDVHYTKLISAVAATMPTGVTASQFAVTITAASAQPAGAQLGGAMLDTSGRTHIGTIAITGQAPNLTDVARFVERVASVPGVVGVFPSSQQNTGNVVQFVVQLTLTDQLLTHRYSAATFGGN